VTAQAAKLPADVRGDFVDAMANSADGIPNGLAEPVRQAASTAFQDGFTTAMRETMLLPVAVLVLGVMFASMMRRRSRADAIQSAPAPASA
ncbi:hypothetical protein ACFQ1S_45985, partial [Kibdelosporangium lantanae]